MKGFAMLGIGKAGWIEKERPVCGPLDAIVKPLALSPCTSDIHTVWEGALGDRHNMILGHEGCGVVTEVGSLILSKAQKNRRGIAWSLSGRGWRAIRLKNAWRAEPKLLRIYFLLLS